MYPYLFQIIGVEINKTLTFSILFNLELKVCFFQFICMRKTIDNNGFVTLTIFNVAGLNK